MLYSQTAGNPGRMTRAVATANGKALRDVAASVVTLGANLQADGYKTEWTQWIVDKQPR